MLQAFFALIIYFPQDPFNKILGDLDAEKCFRMGPVENSLNPQCPHLPCLAQAMLVQQQSPALIYKRESNGIPKFSWWHKWSSDGRAQPDGRCVGWIPVSDDRVMLLSPHSGGATTTELIAQPKISSKKISHAHQRTVRGHPFIT